MKRHRTAFRFGAGFLVLLAAVPLGAWLLHRDDRPVTTVSDLAYEHFVEGDLALRKHYYVEARAHWEAAVAADPDFAMAWQRLARVAYDLEGPEEARTLLDKALARIDDLKPIERIHIELVDAQFDKDRERLEALRTRLIEKFPDDEQALFHAGGRHFYRGELDEALAIYERIAGEFPHRGDVYNMIGYANARLERWEAAVEAFQKYVFLHPDEANPHDSLGELYLRTGRYDDALHEFDLALAAKSDFSWALYHGFYAHFYTGRFEQALETVDRARKVDDSMLYTWSIQEALVRIAQNDLDRALEIVDGLIEEKPDKGTAQFFAVRIHAARGEIEAAESRLADYVAAALERDPDPEKPIEESHSYHELRAYIARAKNDWDAAEAHLRKADGKADMWTLNQRVRDERIEALVHLGRFDEAIAFADTVFAVNPNRVESNYWTGRAHEALGHLEQAAERYRNAGALLERADDGHPLAAECARRLQEIAARRAS